MCGFINALYIRLLKAHVTDSVCVCPLCTPKPLNRLQRDFHKLYFAIGAKFIKQILSTNYILNRSGVFKVGDIDPWVHFGFIVVRYKTNRQQKIHQRRWTSMAWCSKCCQNALQPLQLWVLIKNFLRNATTTERALHSDLAENIKPKTLLCQDMATSSI